MLDRLPLVRRARRSASRTRSATGCPTRRFALTAPARRPRGARATRDRRRPQHRLARGSTVAAALPRHPAGPRRGRPAAAPAQGLREGLARAGRDAPGVVPARRARVLLLGHRRRRLAGRARAATGVAVGDLVARAAAEGRHRPRRRALSGRRLGGGLRARVRIVRAGARRARPAPRARAVGARPARAPRHRRRVPAERRPADRRGAPCGALRAARALVQVERARAQGRRRLLQRPPASGGLLAAPRVPAAGRAVPRAARLRAPRPVRAARALQAPAPRIRRPRRRADAPLLPARAAGPRRRRRAGVGTASCAATACGAAAPRAPSGCASAPPGCGGASTG